MEDGEEGMFATKEHRVREGVKGSEEGTALGKG